MVGTDATNTWAAPYYPNSGNATTSRIGDCRARCDAEFAEYLAVGEDIFFSGSYEGIHWGFLDDRQSDARERYFLSYLEGCEDEAELDDGGEFDEAWASENVWDHLSWDDVISTIDEHLRALNNE